MSAFLRPLLLGMIFLGWVILRQAQDEGGEAQDEERGSSFDRLRMRERMRGGKRRMRREAHPSTGSG